MIITKSEAPNISQKLSGYHPDNKNILVVILSVSMRTDI